MSTEPVPPPTYSFSGDTSPRNSPSPSEDLVSAQSHSSSVPADAEGNSDGDQHTPNIVDAALQPQDAPITPGPPPPDQCYLYALPFPQRRPPSPTPLAVSSQARISAFPDHKLAPVAPRLRLATGAASSSTPATQPKFNPTNYVAVFRKTHKRAFSLSRFSASIKGTFAVDPFLEIPAPLLAPLAPGETTRKNLLLTVENGGIDVDVHLIGEPAPAAAALVARTELHLELSGAPDNAFPLIAKIHTPTLRRPPFRVALVSANGFVSLHLPPSFHGLLTLHVGAGDLNTRITLSAALGAHATILSEDSTVRAYFIGALGTARWEGDLAEVRVERGRVRVQFSGGGERDLDGLRRVGWGLMGF
ncbi:hypothetical protein DFH07DRAFT_757275 [Mycena maculata]|uniref:DUF7330 domain-containing protein n=1 Tax=Mycena maculata TaxID=230809 RepID=A0AAD7MQH1_9AGAR|nr:hypothetical protein DFH07DRAFT_757275 [Mycena maculata]